MKPRSEIDLLMTVAASPGKAVWRALVALLDVSALSGSTANMCPLEATIVMRGDVVPWCHGVIRPDARCSWMSGSAAIYRGHR